jgi:glycine cleavage system H protein
MTMEPLFYAAQTALVFVAGLLIRFFILAVGLVLLSIPVASVLAGVRLGTTVRERLTGILKAGHLYIKRGLFYAPGHTWIRDEGAGVLRVGVDDFAQSLLADATAIILPDPGTQVTRGQPLAEVESHGRRTAVVSPADGTVLEANAALGVRPGHLNRDPYRKGWLVRLSPGILEHRVMKTGEAAREWLGAEQARLSRFLEHRLELVAADGGELVGPTPALLHDDAWEVVTTTFLRG